MHSTLLSRQFANGPANLNICIRDIGIDLSIYNWLPVSLSPRLDLDKTRMDVWGKGNFYVLQEFKKPNTYDCRQVMERNMMIVYH